MSQTNQNISMGKMPCNNPHTLRIGGLLLPLDAPLVMGIMNITEDSFFEGSRCLAPDGILARAHQIIAEGGSIIDIGAYSTRPGAKDIPQPIEIERVMMAVHIVKRAFPHAVISVDTFRSAVVRAVIEKYGAVIINDISGGGADPKMFETIAEYNVPYILMHSRGTPQTMQQLTDYDDIMGSMIYYFSMKIKQLHLLGVCGIILDPGFGFAKTTAQNFTLLARLTEFNIFNMPILAGLSRKSMICKPLNILPEHALNGTTALNVVALHNGASLLRVHDVKPAVEAINLMRELKINAQNA